jgi:Trk-type K+ transport system membrane component
MEFLEHLSRQYIMYALIALTFMLLCCIVAYEFGKHMVHAQVEDAVRQNISIEFTMAGATRLYRVVPASAWHELVKRDSTNNPIHWVD